MSSLLVNTLQEIGSLLWSKRRMLVLGFVAGAILGITYTFIAKPKFKSNLIFLINDNKSGMSSPLSMLAGQFGLPSSSPSATEDRIMFLYGSNKILGGALLSKFENGVTLADSIIHFYSWNEGWGEDSILSRFSNFNKTNPEQLTKYEQAAMNVVIKFLQTTKRLNVDSYKKKASGLVGSQNSGVMAISFEFPSEAICKELPAAIYAELSKFYSLAVTQNLQQNFDALQFRADSLESVLRDLEYRTAGALDQSFNVNKYIGRVEEERLKRDLQIVELMYAEVIKNRELAKFTLNQEKPVFYLIDKPAYPLEQVERSKLVFGVAGGMAFLFLGLFVFIFGYFRNKGYSINQLFL